MSSRTVPGAAVSAFARDRAALLLRLTWVGPGLLAGLIVLTVFGAAVPATAAVAVGWLIDRLVTGGSAVAPLAAYALTVLTGHAVAAARQPLAYLAAAQAVATVRLPG